MGTAEEVKMDTRPSLIVEDWRPNAKCFHAAHMTDQFFSETERVRKEATRFCRGCPTRSECLAEALDADIPFGVWGGMTERQRTRFMSRHSKPPLGFSSWAAYVKETGASIYAM